MKADDGVEMLRPRDRAAWRAWLERNHDSESRLWLVLPKKGSTTPGISYEEAVEEAIAFGWIDSKVRKLDADSYMQSFSPRKPNSPWSASNKRRAERLMEQGMMATPGIAAIEAAKRNGLW